MVLQVNIMETWKDIKGFEGMYQVSNFGNVRSLDRCVQFKDGRVAHYRGKPMKTRITADGYVQVQICRDCNSVKTVKVHRLVAEAFVPNPDGMKEVNHIDEDKTNNRAENLEWSDRLRNCNHGTRNERISRSNGIPVSIHNSTGAIVFPSFKAAAKYLGVSTESVRCAFRDGYKCRGYEVRTV